MLTHIPNETGYYSERLEILDLTLNSLMVNTDKALYDLLVLDNGSNRKTAELLNNRKKDGQIDYLLSSKDNLGVCNGISLLLSAAPGELVCYTNDDVYFKKGWLEESIGIMNAFPDVGLVTPSPQRGTFNQSHTKAYESIYSSYKSIKRLEPKWERKWDEIWCNGIGINYNDYVKNNSLDQLKLLEVDGVQAYPLGGHFVSLMKREVLKKILPFPKTHRLMGGSTNDKTSLINLFDQAINDLGLVKLTTNGCFAEHIGNKIDERLLRLKYDLISVNKAPLEDNTKTSYKLTFTEKVIVIIFKLPIFRSIPKFFFYMFDKINFLKSVYRIKS